MNLGLIGNCSYSALVENGAVRWLCWPRMDSSFVFGNLLDDRCGGEFSVEMPDATAVEQHYVENTNVVRTVFRGPTGSFELLDFAPRFRLYDRFFKPSMLVRILRPLEGAPLVRIRCVPTYDYGRRTASTYCASNHIEFTGLDAPLRLTSNASLTYVQEGRAFVLARDLHLALTWGQPLESTLEATAEDFLQRTVDYWRRWVKRMRIPREYQREVIRSALVLKLHQYEDTGALLAATTTSLPEHPGSGRCWDYRFCWLRDSYFTLAAFERLGHLEEMERFLGYLRNLCALHPDQLQPLYGINGESEAREQILEHLAGFRGDGPVRIGNQAYEHIQNDAYGEMILAISRIVLDVRFSQGADRSTALQLIVQLLAQIERRLEQPDAGLWELRNRSALHSFTILMHWAGARRAAEVGIVANEPALVDKGRELERRARQLLETRCWDETHGVLTQAADSPHLDAAMLLALHFGFFAKDDPRAARHVERIRTGLAVDGGLLRRYAVEDDFGTQEAAFTVCSFWMVEALAFVGRRDEAQALFAKLLGHANSFGLFSEDILPATGELSGNFPQTYSHVGLINAAFRLARDWD
jgi:GH15 family glucan-1,4-alpha-glucosidase